MENNDKVFVTIVATGFTDIQKTFQSTNSVGVIEFINHLKRFNNEPFNLDIFRQFKNSDLWSSVYTPNVRFTSDNNKLTFITEDGTETDSLNIDDIAEFSFTYHPNELDIRLFV